MNGFANDAAKMPARLNKKYEASARYAKHTPENLASGQVDSIRVPKIYAKRASLCQPTRRSVSTNTLSKTLPTGPAGRNRLPVLRQSQLNHSCSCLFCWARKRRKQNDRHLAHRLTMRLWDSALKDTSALITHVARAAGIELAHREGQDVIRHAGIIDDSIKAHLLFRNWLQEGI